MSDLVGKAPVYTGKFQTYFEAFKVHEDGKHRRYSLLFSVNGGALAIAKMFSDPNVVIFLRSLKIWEVAVGMIVFTTLMWCDLWVFAERMRCDVGDVRGPASKGVFSRTGKIVISVVSFLIVFRVAGSDALIIVKQLTLAHWRFTRPVKSRVASLTPSSVSLGTLSSILAGPGHGTELAERPTVMLPDQSQQVFLALKYHSSSLAEILPLTTRMSSAFRRKCT
jgi:hypothetical protein